MLQNLDWIFLLELILYVKSVSLQLTLDVLGQELEEQVYLLLLLLELTVKFLNHLILTILIENILDFFRNVL
jgi:hypothetical protein